MDYDNSSYAHSQDLSANFWLFMTVITENVQIDFR